MLSWANVFGAATVFIFCSRRLLKELSSNTGPQNLALPGTHSSSLKGCVDAIRYETAS